jgi:hypothetical protein
VSARRDGEPEHHGDDDGMEALRQAAMNVAPPQPGKRCVAVVAVTLWMHEGDGRGPLEAWGSVWPSDISVPAVKAAIDTLQAALPGLEAAQ